MVPQNEMLKKFTPENSMACLGLNNKASSICYILIWSKVVKQSSDLQIQVMSTVAVSIPGPWGLLSWTCLLFSCFNAPDKVIELPPHHVLAFSRSVLITHSLKSGAEAENTKMCSTVVPEDQDWTSLRAIP